MIEIWTRKYLQKLYLQPPCSGPINRQSIAINDALEISFAKILPLFDGPKAIIESQALQILDSEQANEFFVSHFMY